MFTTIATSDGTPIAEIGVDTEPRLVLHSAKRGDERLVLSQRANGQPSTRRDVLGALTPAEARRFAQLLLDGADLIDPEGSPERQYDLVFNDKSARGRFKEGMSIARSIFRQRGQGSW